MMFRPNVGVKHFGRSPNVNTFAAFFAVNAVLAIAPNVRAHLIGNAEHDALAQRFAREFAPVQLALRLPEVKDTGGRGEVVLPRMAALFERFAPAVRVRYNEKFVFVESNGLPAHGMMIGITTWQQQVPLPQAYFGGNAWQIPLHPVPSANPISIRGRFLRGAIALAANGIPIFNPQNNRGEISAEIGELDQWGGHCGRADDYHYHVAPLHLQSVLGRDLPIALALDGYPIYGLMEPDGSAPKNLDAFDGHETAALGYHYHASVKYPYVNGGFHGIVVERDDQVDPQPRGQSVRPAQPPLRGAKIIGFTAAPDQKSFALRYTVDNRPAALNYAAVSERAWKFKFVDPDSATREATYSADADERGGGGPPSNRPPPPRDRAEARPPDRGAGANQMPEFTPPRTGNFALRSPAIGSDDALPVEFTGDGESASPPLAWSGAPTGTKSFAVIMHHIDPEGLTKWYWTLYNIPSDVRSLPKNAQGIGTLGNNSIDRRLGYAPPHSKGPGAKTYVLTVYALSAPVAISAPPSAVNRAVLLAAMKNLILDSAELKVVYTRTGEPRNARDGPAAR